MNVINQSTLPKSTQLLGLIGWVLACTIAMAAGGWATSAGLEWYQTLQKPSWTPPDAVFAPIWTVLYLAMAVAAWLVWRNQKTAYRRALAVFVIQLTLNTMWSYLFFFAGWPGGAAIELVVLWLAIILNIRVFWPHSILAAMLMVPYWLWVTFAGALNLAIWRLNA